MIIKTELRVSQNQISYEKPEMELDGSDELTEVPSHIEFATFQANYIDIIPTTWTVVSMTLNESQEELLISKLRAGHSPLVLRLPLSRPNSLESEDEGFSFKEGKAELQEIVQLANESTRGAQDFSQKGAKTKWWEARSALDARLQDLLMNIERIWLGGFKGIFSQGATNHTLLPRLQKSLKNILDKHLPSRQKSGKRKVPGHSDFDSRIIELFVGLGYPSETNDIDEPLMDLLYFVVDILQFNGERNAYDEVDFDSVRALPYKW